MNTRLYFLLSLLFFSCSNSNGGKDNSLIDLAFGDAIDKIEQQSKDWQQVVKDLEKEIKDDVSNIIKNELTNFTQTTISSIGVEFRCDVKFINDFVVKKLKKIRNDFRQSAGFSPLPVLIRPTVCSPVPSVINLKVEEVVFFGYDLIKGQVKLIMEYKDGKKEDITDKYLNFLSEFKCNVIIGGGGLKPLAEHKRILLECSSCSVKFLSEVPFNVPPIEKKSTTAFGGGGGTPFDDLTNVDSVKRVSGFRISSGKGLDLVQIQYEYFSGKKFWQQARGSISNPVQEILFTSDEYWKGIIIRHGSRIDELQIITNKRALGPYGGKGGAEVKLEDLGEIIGISGRAEAAIDALIFYYRK